MKRGLALFFVALVGVGASACGNKQSCDYRPQRTYCEEKIGKGALYSVPGSGGTRDAACTNAGGNPGGGCDTGGSLGGCTTSAAFSDGVTTDMVVTNTWYFADSNHKTSADVMKLCTNRGASYVSP